MGRILPFALVGDAVSELRRAGVNQISFDLMYGLPGQTMDDVLTSVRLASSLSPDRIALFGYAHVPWFKRRQRLINELSLPDTQARFEQADAARAAALERVGYVSIGLDHFAKPDDPLAIAAQTGALRRNFQGYAAGDADVILGFGPSTISTLPQGFAQNVSAVRAWERAIEAGHFATVRGHAHTDDDRRRAQIINAIMCEFEADLAPLGGRVAFATELDALAPLVADGVVQIDGDRLSVPRPMHPFCRLVAQAFDAYGERAARHSRAI